MPDAAQLQCFVQRGGGGLVAHHRHADVQRGDGGRQVHVIGRDDGQEIDAVVPPRLVRQHGVQVGIGTGCIDAILRARLARTFGTAAERACNQYDMPVQFRCDPMDRTDKSAGPATNHAHTDFCTDSCHVSPPYCRSDCGDDALVDIPKRRSVPSQRRHSHPVAKMEKGRFRLPARNHLDRSAFGYAR